MVRPLLLSSIVFSNLVWYSTDASTHYIHFATRQPPLRVAFIGFVGAKPTKDSAALDSAFAEALGRDSRLSLIDQSQIQLALKGVGYDGSVNLRKEEARRLGAAIGCDFFIVGRAETLTRSEREKESHEEAYAGVMIVDARTGALARFDFISERASTREAALGQLVKTFGNHVENYMDRMIQARTAGGQSPSKDSASLGPSTSDPIEDIPDEGSPRAIGFKPPEFLNRVKPEYTGEAEQADITATVEAAAVFRSDGEVGSIEITRWAGFGLDESSERAIRQLKFKPAMRDGKPVSVRALIRHNFRRIDEANSKPEPPAAKLPDKPENDLRQLFKPTYRRP